MESVIGRDRVPLLISSLLSSFLVIQSKNSNSRNVGSFRRRTQKTFSQDGKSSGPCKGEHRVGVRDRILARSEQAQSDIRNFHPIKRKLTSGKWNFLRAPLRGEQKGFDFRRAPLRGQRGGSWLLLEEIVWDEIPNRSFSACGSNFTNDIGTVN